MMSCLQFVRSSLRQGMVCGVSLLLGTLLAVGQETILPVQDRTLSRSGDTVQLFSANDARLFAGAGSAEVGELRALFNFKLDKSSAQITRATTVLLKITRQSQTGKIGTYRLIHVTDAPGAVVIDKSAFDATGELVKRFDGSALRDNETLAINVTACVKKDIEDGRSFALFRIEAESPGGVSDNIRLYPGQGGGIPSDASYRAQLQIQ
ncbi:MAG: hypothetical protein Q7Q73_07555 [Verrucomicrobiota bacterium JB024]|nr:hypothetical protein [Verrucomicrobiota bacterium JB024]